MSDAQPRRCSRLALAGLALCLAATPAVAQPAVAQPARPNEGQETKPGGPEVKRVELGRRPVSGVEGREIVVQLVEIPPGATSRRHVHNGEESYYVLEGGTVQVPDKAPVARPAGEHGINLRGVPHAGYTNVGDTVLKILSVYVVDTDKPLQVPVP